MIKKALIFRTTNEQVLNPLILERSVVIDMNGVRRFIHKTAAMWSFNLNADFFVLSSFFPSRKGIVLEL